MQSITDIESIPFTAPWIIWAVYMMGGKSWEPSQWDGNGIPNGMEIKG